MNSCALGPTNPIALTFFGALGPVDAVDCLVGEALRFPDRACSGCDVEHATTIGDDLATALARPLNQPRPVAAEEIGIASAIKMCRSIMIKGIEALVVESMFAARRFGAEEAVLASLDRTFPHMGWSAQLPDYLVSRVAEHGRRRAAEMREVAATLGL